MQTARVSEGYGIAGTVLYMALELSAKKWLVGFSTGGNRLTVLASRPGSQDRSNFASQVSNTRRSPCESPVRCKFVVVMG